MTGRPVWSRISASSPRSSAPPPVSMMPLSAMSAQSLPSCATCFARWRCCGDCPAKVLDINSTNRRKNPYRCFVNKRIIKHLVMTEVDKAMKSVTNATLKKKERLCEKEGAGREFP